MFNFLQQALPVADWVEGFTDWLTGTFACRSIFDGWDDQSINDDSAIIIDSCFDHCSLFHLQ